MIQTHKKAIELISQKYFSRIVAFGDKKHATPHSLLDNKTSTLFSISNSHCTFRDHNGNLWITIPETLMVNKKRYYPVIGDTYSCDEITISFCAIETIVEMATNYFEKFIDPYYGFDLNWNLNFFCEETEGEKIRYQLVESKFKSSQHHEIDAYISFN